MTSNILTKQKKYGWRIKLLFFLVILLSSSIAYLAQKKLLVSEIDAKESVQQIKEESYPLAQEAQESETEKKDESASIVIATPTDQEEKAQEKTEEKIVEKAEVPLPVIERNKNPETRLSEAMIYAQPQILTGKYIDVSLTYQNIVIFQDGKPLKAYLISSGMRVYILRLGH